MPAGPTRRASPAGRRARSVTRTAAAAGRLRQDEGMPTLRIALRPGQPDGRRPRRQRRARPRVDPPGRRRRRPAGRLPGDDADRLPGRGPGLPASPSSRASRAALQRLAADLAADGLGELAVVVGYLDADGPAAVSADADAGPRAPQRARAAARRRVVGHLLQAPPAQLRRLRRGPLLRPRRHADRGADRRGGRGADHLRGPLAGRRAVRGRPAGRGRAGASTSTARRTS